MTDLERVAAVVQEVARRSGATLTAAERILAVVEPRLVRSGSETRSV